MTPAPEPKTAESVAAAKILYYCRDCKKAIAPVRIGNKFQFKCGDCKNKSVAFGTEKSIHNFYDIEGGRPADEKSEKEEKKFKSFDEYAGAIKLNPGKPAEVKK
ncbi:hypothetical protein HZA43_04000 [Candidatus Peregrinibacteria bacterium]|nr:hypothetical protein [Candidatus Peregrinibacteria bacterium]